MKNVKMMLAAIALVAVLGGTYAFKAQKYSLQKIYTQRDPGTGKCTVALTSSTITTVDPGTAKVFAHTTNSEICPLNWTKQVPND